MQADDPSVLLVTYHTWRQRLGHIHEMARRLRPHAHQRRKTSAAHATAWNPFSFSHPHGTPSARDAASTSAPMQQQQQQRFKTDEDLVNAVLHEFEQLLLALRLDTRFSESPTARVAEAQTLLCRAAFYHEVQLHLSEKQRRLRTESIDEGEGNSGSSSDPPSSSVAGISGYGEDGRSLSAMERRSRRRARYAQQQRNYLYAEAQDYLASGRLWLDMERERKAYGLVTSDEALSYGVLCGASACGVMLRGGDVRAEENPIPHALYDRASHAFHRSHTAPQPASLNNNSNSSGSGGNANALSPTHTQQQSAPMAGYLVGGDGNLEPLLEAFRGQPLPPNVPPPPSSPGVFLAWDDYPPTAHPRAIRQVHSLLMGLGATLAEEFCCYELSTNYYELAALVLLEGVPQWMWRGEDDDSDDSDDGSSTATDTSRNEAPATREAATAAAAPPPQTLSGGAAVQRRLRLLSPSFSTFGQEQQEEPTTLYARMLQQMRRYEETYFHKGSGATTREGRAEVGGSFAAGSFSASSSSPLSPSQPQPVPSSAPAASRTRVGLSTTRQNQRAANIRSYLQVADDVRLHRSGCLFPYLQAARAAMEAAVVTGDNARVLLFANTALRVLQTEELILFDTLSLELSREPRRAGPANETDSRVSTQNERTGAAAAAHRTRVRLPIVDRRRQWPRSRQEHFDFRRGTAKEVVLFHVARFLVLVNATADEVGRTTRSGGGGDDNNRPVAPTLPSTTMGTTGTAKEKATESEEAPECVGQHERQQQQQQQQLRWWQRYADTAAASVDALTLLVADLAALEACTVTLLHPAPRRDTDKSGAETERDGERELPRSLCVLTTCPPPSHNHGGITNTEMEDAPATATRDEPPSSSASGGFLQSAVYARVKAAILENAQRACEGDDTNANIAHMPELSSSESESDGTSEEVVVAGASSYFATVGTTEECAKPPSPVSAASTVDAPSHCSSRSLERLVVSLRALLLLVQRDIPFDVHDAEDEARHHGRQGSRCPAASPPQREEEGKCNSTREGKQSFYDQLSTVEEALGKMGLGSRSLLMLMRRLQRKFVYPPLAITPFSSTRSDN